jgi:uncharacterized protein (DUF58 family)
MFLQGRWVGQAPEDPGKVLRDIFVILLIVVMIVGAATGSALVVALGGLAFVVIVTARLWSVLSLEDIQYTLSSKTTHAFIGDEIEIVMNIENRKPLPVPWLHFHEFISQGLELIGREDQFIDYMGGTPLDEVVSLGRYERLRRRYMLRTLSRGHYHFGPSELTSGDLFGLYVRKVNLAIHSWDLIVYPDIFPLPELELPTARPIGDAHTRIPVWRDPTRPAGIREYRSGDPMKSIDWKATARRNELFVKVFDPSVSEYAVVLTEGTTTDRPWEGFRLDVLEALASCAGSVASHALAQGFRTGLIVNSTLSLGGRNVVRPASGPAQLPAMLEALAMMRPAIMESLQQLARAHARDAVPAGATIFFVAGQLRASAVAYVSELAQRGHPVTTLWVGREDPPAIPALNILDYRAPFGVGESYAENVFSRPVGKGRLEQGISATEAPIG